MLILGAHKCQISEMKRAAKSPKKYKQEGWQNVVFFIKNPRAGSESREDPLSINTSHDY